MKLSGIIEESIVDGPGIRITIFFQGCTHHCYKCHNEKTWDFNLGKTCSLEQIDKIIENNPHTDGITLSGGDPLDQYEDCLTLCKHIKNKYKDLNIILYTGYTYEQIIQKHHEEIYSYIDYLVDGLFIYEKLDLTLLFRGSTNQRFIDIKKSLKENKVHEMTDHEINMI